MQNPSVTLNTPSQSRQQVPLRDYLNVRIAPFLKKGLTESLDKEPEYPLQWLGEYLINQSILFEGNTEAEKLKEHFRYTFPLPQQPESTQQQQQQQQQQSQPTKTGADTNGVVAQAPQAPAHEEIVTATNGQESNATRNESSDLAAAQQLLETPVGQPAAAGDTASLPPIEGDRRDTEMGGTT